MKYNYDVSFRQLLPTYPSRQSCFADIVLWWEKTANFGIKMKGLFVSLLFLFLKKKFNTVKIHLMILPWKQEEHSDFQACGYVSIISVRLGQSTHPHTHIFNSKGKVRLESNFVLCREKMDFFKSKHNKLFWNKFLKFSFKLGIFIHSPVANRLIRNLSIWPCVALLLHEGLFSSYGLAKSKFANKNHLSIIQEKEDLLFSIGKVSVTKTI